MHRVLTTIPAIAGSVQPFIYSGYYSAATETPAANESGDSDNSSDGLIVGIVIAIVVIACLIVAGVWYKKYQLKFKST